MKLKEFPQIIAISGIDGSGKSTQIDFMAEHFKELGIKHRKVWLRWPAFFSYPFLALCRLLGYTEWKEIPGTDEEWADRKFYRNPYISKIWKLLFMLDTLVYYAIKVRVPEKLGYNVLCDRYIPDVLVDMICDTKDGSIINSFLGKILRRRMKDVSLVILDLESKIAYERKRDTPSVKYLKKRRKIYLELAKKLDIPMLKGNNKPSKIAEKLWELFK